MSTEPDTTPKRTRPTVRALHEANLTADTERRKRADVERQLATRYAEHVRGGRWGLSTSEQAEVDLDVAGAVERILVAAGSRFGARLIAAQMVTEVPR